ncbi:endoglucanase [Bradyrhizobium sp. USDA 4472]
MYKKMVLPPNLAIMLRALARLSLAFTLFAPPTAFAAQNVTLKGREFFLDGKPWLPKGIDVEALNRPLGNYESASLQELAKQVRQYWGPAEIGAIKNVFGAQAIRLTISQPGLDPQSAIYSAAYRDQVLKVIRQARAGGFVVIPNMDAQGENGVPNLPCMPNDSTTRAWKTLAPSLINDPGVMFELFNEPCRANWDQARKEWASEMQVLVDMFRAMGARNILLLDGLGYAQWTNDLFPLVHDSFPDRLALAVHPYLDGLKKEPTATPESYFSAHFGRDAASYPIIATEWNAVETNGCVDGPLPEIALSLVRYLQHMHIGLIGWAIDSEHGKLVKDHIHFEPTNYDDFQGCSGKNGPNISGAGRLLAAFPNN